MQILLFRHAERANTGSDNPPLTARGQAQARALYQLIKDKKIEVPQRMLCSPKLRALKTFQVTAEALSVDLQIWEDLDERKKSESSSTFLARVRRCIESLSTLTGSVFVCSHIDWIDDALAIIPCDVNLNQPQYLNWMPGQYMEFEIQNELWHLIKQGVLPEC